MRVHQLARITSGGAQTSTVLNAADGEALSPFTEGRQCVAQFLPDGSWAGTLEKLQGSADGGTTWTDIADVSTPLNSAVAHAINFTMPNRLRFSATRSTGSLTVQIFGSY